MPEGAAPKKKALSTQTKALYAFAAVAVVGGTAAGIIVAVMPGKKGGSLTIPALKPPVEQASPDLLVARRRNLLRLVDRVADHRKLLVERRGLSLCNTTVGANNGPDCKTPIEVIEERMYSSGPTNFLDRLESVDGRMEELVARDADVARKCVTETPEDWTPTLPSGAPTNFQMKFSCMEEMGGPADGSSDLKVFFGKAADFTYIAEIQQASGNSFNGAVLARINEDASDVHVWVIGSGDSGSTSSIFEIVATLGEGSGVDATVLQVAFATNEEGTTGIGCGIQLHRMGDRVFVSGTFADSDCGTQPLTQVCLDADDLSDLDMSACSAFDADFTDGLTPLDATVAAAYASDAADLIDTFGGLPALSLTDFNAQ